MKTKKVIAILPIKDNSDRVKDKNFKIIGKQPLLFYIVDSLLNASSISKIIVNTDSERAIELLSGYNELSSFEISWRPDDLQGDFISMNKIINYEINRYGRDYDYLQTHVTNPFLRPKTIDLAVKKFHLEKGNRSLVSLNEFYTRFFNSKMLPINHESNNLLRSQDLNPIYEENSCLYVFSYENFMNKNTRISSNPIMFKMNKYEAFDIDTVEDWQFSEYLLNNNYLEHLDLLSR